MAGFVHTVIAPVCRAAGAAGQTLAGAISAHGAATYLITALFRHGIPVEKADILQRAIMNGETVFLMHPGNDAAEDWRQRLLWTGESPVFSVP